MGHVAFASPVLETAMKGSAKYKYFKDRGHKVSHVWGKKSQPQWEKELQDYDHVIIYNGFRHEYAPVRRAAEAIGIPHSFWEGGILPARRHQFIDREGILAASSLCKDISWVGKPHIRSYQKWRKRYFADLGIAEKDSHWKGGKYIFCPMQCHWDANFYPENGWSKFTGTNAMQNFMKEVQRKFPNDTIYFRCHPADMPNIGDYRAILRGHNKVLDGAWDNDYKKHEPKLMKLILNAKQVIGINSTCLLQSLMAGAPTVAMGKGYVRAAGKNPKQHTKMLAAVRHRSFIWNSPQEAYPVLDELFHEGDLGSIK